MRVSAFWMLVMVFGFLIPEVRAQVHLDVRLSERHQSKLERTEDVRKKWRKYKKMMSRQEKRALKTYQDSVKHVALDLVPYDSSMISSHLPDSAGRVDSIEWALNTLAQHHQYGAIQSYFQNLDSADLKHLDSLELVPQAASIAQRYLPEDLPTGEANSLTKDLPLGPEAPVDGLAEQLPLETGGDPKAQVDQLQEKLSKEQLGTVQAKLSKLKEKYISLPDLSDSESGVKRNSLKGSPLKDRLYLGGNVVVQSTDPLVLDTDLQVGYKLNKKSTFGIGLQWREPFGKLDSTHTVSPAVHGYSVFTSYDLWAGIYGYGAFGALKNTSLFPEGSDREVHWQYEYLIGIGRKFSVARFLDLNVTFLYDLNHRNNDTHPRPFMVRLGYGINGTGWLKKN